MKVRRICLCSSNSRNRDTIAVETFHCMKKVSRCNVQYLPAFNIPRLHRFTIYQPGILLYAPFSLQVLVTTLSIFPNITRLRSSPPLYMYTCKQNMHAPLSMQ